MQLGVTAISLVLGTVTGCLTGVILKSASISEPMNDDFYEDAGWWNVPDDDEEVPEIADTIVRQHDMILRDTLKKVGDSLGLDLITGTKLATLPHTDACHAVGHTNRQVGAMPKLRGARISANNRFLEGSEHGMDNLFFPDTYNPQALKEQQTNGARAPSLTPRNAMAHLCYSTGYA